MTNARKPLALLVAACFAAPAFAQQSAKDDKTDVGTISITGEGDRLGTGQMIQEDSPKARSTVTKSAIDKLRPTSNPYQAMQLLPGVNTSNQDATGLFGGNLRVRGFNSDQMGFTVDGAPVNDSGSFSVFPQEYSDAENTCEIFLTQGSADNDAPHVGASGGNVGIVTCDPLATRTARIQQTLGQLGMTKTFLRGDTGKLDVLGGWTSFASFSHAEADKFKGPGKARRDHIDVKSILDLTGGSRLVFTGLFNEAVNNNFRTISKAQYAADPNTDFNDTFVPNPAGGPGRQAAPVQPNGNAAFYKLSLNPFRNAVMTAKGNFQVTPSFRFDVEPYFWYGYGTGGTQQFTLNEGGTFKGGVADLNGDGDRLDSLLVYRSSVTQTYRPGGTVKGTWAIGDHKVTVGYWTERARHKQTGPATSVDAGGNSADIWLQGNLLTRVDGSAFQLRDWLTISTAGSLFVQDSFNLLNDRLNVFVGVKRPYIDRDFNNYANEGTGQGLDYSAKKRFDDTLPSLGLRWQATDEHQLFLNVAKNFKAPGNFVYSGAIVNGVNTVDAINAKLRAETAVNTDIGYRFLGKTLTFSGSVFLSDFKDRLARQFDPDQGLVLDRNVGDATVRGVEMELGTRPVKGWSAYTSVSYTKSRIKNDLAVSATNLQPTAGKEFPDTPNWLLGASVQYATGPLFANLQAKYTGKRYTSLTNDDSVPGYTTVDFNAGYRFRNVEILKNPTLRLSVTNVTNEKYLVLTGPSGSLFVTNTVGTGAGTPTFYVGAPRYFTASLSAEF